MARIDRELAAVIAGDVLLFVILAVCIAAQMSLSAQGPDSTPREGLRGGGHAEPAPWPEPAAGTYAR